MGRSARRGLTAAPALDPLELLVDGLATYRLTRFATADVLSEPFRQAVLRRVGIAPPAPGDDGDDGAGDGGGLPSAQELVEADVDPPRLATLVTCRWCAGVWIAAGVVVARTAAPRAWTPVARGLALSAGAVLLSRLEDG